MSWFISIAPWLFTPAFKVRPEGIATKERMVAPLAFTNCPPVTVRLLA